MNLFLLSRIVILLLLGNVVTTASQEGYVLFCPCMGRFGNQVDHYLGTLAFAKAINRTLVLPPFVEYRPHSSTSIQVPFDTYFDAEAVRTFHEAILMEDFMKRVAPALWPPDHRIAFCYSPRPGLNDKTSNSGSCNPKSGNPFGPFWDTFHVDFVASETFGVQGLHYDVHDPSMASKWKRIYPPSEWPVLAFTGAPAPFPIRSVDVPLHKYLRWNIEMNEKAEKWIRQTLSEEPFVGIHLRNGMDWKRACDLIPTSPLLFSAAQCVGYDRERGTTDMNMCLPSLDTVVRGLRKAVREVGAKAVFIATDNDPMISQLKSHFKNELSFHTIRDSDPHLDLVILGKSSHFIGNCISSFTAFVKRERDVRELPSSFFGFPSKEYNRNEL